MSRPSPDTDPAVEGPPLRRQLLLAVLFPLVVFSLLVILSSASALNALTLDLILARDSAMAQVMAGAVGQRLTDALIPLHSLAAALASQSNDPAQQAQTLLQASPALPDSQNCLLLLNRGGAVIAATPACATRAGRAYGGESEVQQALRTNALAFSGLMQDVSSGQMTVRIAVPVSSSGEAPVTAILLAILPPRDTAFINTIGLASEPRLSGQTAYVVDSTQTILANPDPKQLGQRAPADWLFARLVQNRQAGSALSDLPGTREQVILAYAPLPGLEWGLMLEEPLRAASAPMLSYQVTLALLIVLGVGLSLVTLSLSINRLTRPLVQLGAQAERLVPGSTFRPGQAQGPRELRQLIRAFNQLVIRLAKQQAALRQYAVQVLESQEDERRRIARDLHDETVQDLVGLLQRIELCRASLERDPAVTQLRLDELHTLAAGALADVRRTIHDLRSPILDDLGLSASIDDLCAELHALAPATQVRYNLEGVERRLPPEVELTFYRIVQEALTNVRRHARQATLVEVRLCFSAQGVIVIVADNGAGFVVPSLPALMRGGHLGLTGMFERARLIGAQLSVESAKSQGTTINLGLSSAE